MAQSSKHITADNHELLPCAIPPPKPRSKPGEERSGLHERRHRVEPKRPQLHDRLGPYKELNIQHTCQRCSRCHLFQVVQVHWQARPWNNEQHILLIWCSAHQYQRQATAISTEQEID